MTFYCRGIFRQGIWGTNFTNIIRSSQNLVALWTWWSPIINQFFSKFIPLTTKKPAILNGAQTVWHHPWGNLNFSITVTDITKWYWVIIREYLSYILPKSEDFIPTGLVSRTLNIIHGLRIYAQYVAVPGADENVALSELLFQRKGMWIWCIFLSEAIANCDPILTIQQFAWWLMNVMRHLPERRRESLWLLPQ